MGRRRLTNEDSFVLCEEEGLGVVCDGMGGHHAGEAASRLAVDIFAENVVKARRALDSPDLKLSQARAMAQEFIRDWTEHANAEIHEKGKQQGDETLKSRMGTTLAAVLFVSDFVVVAHVGDSRVYRLRDGVLEQLSEDHVIMAEAQGRHPADPRKGRKRKYVTKALGTKRRVSPDVQVLDVFPGDVFLLCSDGLTDLVDDDEIAKVVNRAGPNRRIAVRTLIDLANKRGGVDNVTVVIGEVRGEPEDDDDDTDLLSHMGEVS